MLVLGLSLPELCGRAHGPDTASIALIARMTAAPDSARRGQIDALVRALKIAGIWPKLAALYLTAAHDAQAARLNWVSGSHDLTEHGALTFTADRGYTGDGSTGYLDSGWSPVST